MAKSNVSSKDTPRQETYENAKSLQEEFYDIGRALTFIRKALENDTDTAKILILTQVMLDYLIKDVKFSGDEVPLCFGITKQATGGEV